MDEDALRAAQAAEWDARYGEREAMWSGRPNGRLVVEVGTLTPGSALDVGCGEGADAMWLAQRGWTVTAIDISDVAIRRAREAAERAGAAVEWLCGDALATPFPARVLARCLPQGDWHVSLDPRLGGKLHRYALLDKRVQGCVGNGFECEQCRGTARSGAGGGVA